MPGGEVAAQKEIDHHSLFSNFQSFSLWCRALILIISSLRVHSQLNVLSTWWIFITLLAEAVVDRGRGGPKQSCDDP